MIARSKKAMQMTTTTENGTYSGACPFRRLGGCFGGIRCGPGCGGACLGLPAETDGAVFSSAYLSGSSVVREIATSEVGVRGAGL